MAPISRRTALTAGAGTFAGLSLPTGAARAKALLVGDTPGAFVSPNPVNPRVVTHVTSMQSGHGWTAANTSASNLNDTTTYAMGAQSASITTRADGVASTLTKVGLALNVSSAKQLRVLVRVDGIDYLQGLNVYVSSDSMVANFGIVYIQSETVDPSVRWLKDGEWKWVTLPWQSAIITGSPDLTAVDSLRVRATSASGATCQ